MLPGVAPSPPARSGRRTALLIRSAGAARDHHEPSDGARATNPAYFAARNHALRTTVIASCALTCNLVWCPRSRVHEPSSSTRSNSHADGGLPNGPWAKKTRSADGSDQAPLAHRP